METARTPPDEQELPALTPYLQLDLPAIRLSTEISLREYIKTVQQLPRGSDGTNYRKRAAALVLADLRALRRQTEDLVRETKSRRSRCWMGGIALSSIMPLLGSTLRSLGKGSDAGRGLPRDTPPAPMGVYQGLLSMLRRQEQPITWTLTAFSVLYVLRNELVFHIGKNMSTRLEDLYLSIKNGSEDVDQTDLDLVTGWQWNFLLFGRS
ncbi:hypothetical protein NA56DRAFT_652781 [Hyaloscypha hepaticicola]|uniref:Uncharacterized protein n=1 Tax=Hyaloscypha hepaticicola TaxID=2082293 RepID=A0A2J6PDC4_9HELO|nr:hypothetical protein NA56DRAFT_652781 [Hyaloscypha hepaticicola]